MYLQYEIYKMEFESGVHFGNGSLNDTKNSFCSDTLFSALCHEALLSGNDKLNELYDKVSEGKIIFSDAMPYIGDSLYIPKPLLKPKREDDNVSDRKKWKNLKYIDISKIQDYLQGELDVEKESVKINNIGNKTVRQSVSLTNPEKSEPYSIGIYRFNSHCGLYVIFGYENEEDSDFFIELMDGLGYSGIGGKKNTGLGKYFGMPEKLDDNVVKMLSTESGNNILLSQALPIENEMSVIDSGNVLFEKKSGFIYSTTFANEPLKKKDMYFLKSGSVLQTRFKGNIYDVGVDGNHPVWRYGIPMFLSV